MAELQTNEGGGKKKKGGSKQKKIHVHVDFTPMVDMNMLLITFFMLCTSLSKPQTMEIVMPTNKESDLTKKNEVKASDAITILLNGGDSIYYYQGKPDFKDYTKLKRTSYNATTGLRAFLLDRNRLAVAKINDLKKKKQDLLIADSTYLRQVSEIKGGKLTPTVIIKATDQATYKNLVDVLDEMAICRIGKYVIDKYTPGDKYLVKNLETKGNYQSNFAN
ncbi:MAG: biopolymer transporter ExbD [Paludibacter sp.]|nr:biopolymer transporter ExbD [Paludibacter sp.]